MNGVVYGFLAESRQHRKTERGQTRKPQNPIVPKSDKDKLCGFRGALGETALQFHSMYLNQFLQVILRTARGSARRALFNTAANRMHTRTGLSIWRI